MDESRLPDRQRTRSPAYRRRKLPAHRVCQGLLPLSPHESMNSIGGGDCGFGEGSARLVHDAAEKRYEKSNQQEMPGLIGRILFLRVAMSLNWELSNSFIEDDTMRIPGDFRAGGKSAMEIRFPGAASRGFDQVFCGAGVSARRCRAVPRIQKPAGGTPAPHDREADIAP